jgi:acyl-CoA synthetase (AMP-forming)/AMP-acid ligase II
MTETGFPLSNPYRPVSERLPGHVGYPMPGAEAAILDLDDYSRLYEHSAQLPSDDFQGELLVRTPAMFDRYLNRHDATRESFYQDSKGLLWFKTGDMATKHATLSGYSYQIKGRLSQDIIKRAGFKISALDIESVLL